MNECRRKSSHSSTESLQQNVEKSNSLNGFLRKLTIDLKKLILYEPNQIKWMNEKPKHKKAYEPTEVSQNINKINVH